MNPSENLDEAKLETVAERSSEVAATILVSVLKDAGIRAIATGGFTSGFRAEAPGVVRIQTLESDAERARQVIAEIEPVE
ncbi:DUF2007 domain-containing protein [Stieleria sp. TO1_6]|uniref:putative signal transducing protein n=1 Tax=Stieleria tagensis TaxID=2956795 RepID=UPI00209AC83B|nr:DUF2007 domain-containing protein [Stieleria tagensis]MCO8122939.1 DUF2007 domain-containing protein [Stieleria tagensis]